MTFELPVDDIMIVDKDKIVSEEMDAAEKERRLIEKQEREKHRQAKKADRQEKRKMRLEALERLRRQRREKSLAKRLIKRTEADKDNPAIAPEIKMELTDEPSTPNESLIEPEAIPPEVESSEPDPHKSYPDPST